MRDRVDAKLKKEKLYRKKKVISSLLRLLAGLGVLSFGLYFMDIFELIGGGVLILISLISFQGINKKINPRLLVRKERDRLKYLALDIIAFSLINPIGVLPAIYDLYKRDFVMRGGFDEK